MLKAISDLSGLVHLVPFSDKREYLDLRDRQDVHFYTYCSRDNDGENYWLPSRSGTDDLTSVNCLACLATHGRRR
jgi:hypothetical protein